MAAMLDRLTVETFSEQLGKSFQLFPDEKSQLDVVLVEARSLSTRSGPAGRPREPFSLVFLGPAAPILPQRIYAIQNEAMGRLEIFLVPIGADARGVRYEAIFN